MNPLAKTCWIAAPIFALCGMAFGIYMSASGDHTLAPSHGHLNLLGWVSIAVYGTFYTIMPRAAENPLAKVQVLLAIAGVVVIVPGIVYAILGEGEGMAKTGSVMVILSMLLFLGIVVREAVRPARTMPVSAPMAENS